MTSWRIENRRSRRPRIGLWHRFVLAVGYAAIGYGLVRGVLYVLVLLGGFV